MYLVKFNSISYQVLHMYGISIEKCPGAFIAINHPPSPPPNIQTSKYRISHHPAHSISVIKVNELLQGS